MPRITGRPANVTVPAEARVAMCRACIQRCESKPGPDSVIANPAIRWTAAMLKSRKK